MPKHILIPVALDHEDVLPKKLALAHQLLEEGGKITLLTVLENVPGFVAEFVTMKEENHLVTKVKDKLDKVAGTHADVETRVETGKAGVVIAQFAESHGADLVIVGSHKPGLQDYFLGSTAARVSRRAPCSVYIMR